jgi:hypothetical protein
VERATARRRRVCADFFFGGISCGVFYGYARFYLCPYGCVMSAKSTLIAFREIFTGGAGGRVVGCFRRPAVGTRRRRGDRLGTRRHPRPAFVPPTPGRARALRGLERPRCLPVRLSAPASRDQPCFAGSALLRAIMSASCITALLPRGVQGSRETWYSSTDIANTGLLKLLHK